MAAAIPFKFASFSMRLARWGMVALVLAIPISTALDNVLLALLLILALPSSGRAVLYAAMKNPVARAAAMLFAALLLGMAYGGASFLEAVNTLGKYADLAFVPLFMVAGRDVITRHRVMQIFLIVMLVTALLSWLVGLHILPHLGWMWGGCSPKNPAIFRSSITQNFLMAYSVYLLVLRVRESSIFRMRWLLITAAAVEGSNVLFMVESKTGYVVLLVLLAYFSWVTWERYLRGRGYSLDWRKRAGICLLGMLLGAGVYQASPRLHEQVARSVKEFNAWRPGANNGSTGERMGFYYNTWLLIKQHPLLGVGTGGFAAAYTQQVTGGLLPAIPEGGSYIRLPSGKELVLTPNPHNEYLLITAQIGIFGLAMLLYLFYAQWRYAPRLPSTFEQDAARGLVIAIAITALFNSPLHDHTEGLFFAFASALLFSGLSVEPNKHDA